MSQPFADGTPLRVFFYSNNSTKKKTTGEKVLTVPEICPYVHEVPCQISWKTVFQFLSSRMSCAICAQSVSILALLVSADTPHPDWTCHTLPMNPEMTSLFM